MRVGSDGGSSLALDVWKGSGLSLAAGEGSLLLVPEACCCQAEEIFLLLAALCKL